jgi:hypothetical protein
MASPGDETTAGSGGHLRASHADRDQVIDGLKAAFVEGRLEQDEFAQRVSRALASRTYADLAALTADLPPAGLPARPPAPARERMSRNTVAAIWGTFAGAVLLACWNLLPESSGPVEILMLLGWLLVFHDWVEKRGPRQTAAGRPPGTGGPAFGHRDQAGPARQVPRADRDPGLTSEAAPRAPGPLRPRIAAAHG